MQKKARGGGQLLAAAKSRDLKTYAVESDIGEIKFMREKGFNVLDAYVDPDVKNDELDAVVGKSDIVSFMMVLEHVKEPARVVDYFYRTMKSGSVFVIDVPRHPSVATFANLTHKGIAYRHITVPVHLQIFTEKAIDMLFGGRFRMLGKWGYGEGFSDLVNFSMFASDAVIDNEIYEKIMEHNNDIQRIFDSAGLSDMMIYVAVKE